MANVSPDDTYAIQIGSGQWLLIRPRDVQERERKDGDKDQRAKTKLTWLRKD